MPIFDQLFARRSFPLPPFEVVPLEFDEDCAAGELLLDQPAAPPCAVPTAGELRESIERHLRGAGAGAPRSDAADELRDALAELRRTLA